MLPLTCDIVEPSELRLVSSPDEQLVLALRAREPGAAARFYDRFAEHVRRVLARTLGVDQDLSDLLQEVFLHAISNIHTLADPARVKAWLSAIAVFTARGHIRRRHRRRWLTFLAPEDLPERGYAAADHEARAAMRAAYALLEKLPTEERLVFTLRFFEGMELSEVASACGVSLATVKRRLVRARRRFDTLAAGSSALREWTGEEGGPR